MAVHKMTSRTGGLIQHAGPGTGSRSGSTTRTPTASSVVVAPDKVKIRPSHQISSQVLESLGRLRTEIDADGVIQREWVHDGNLYVGNSTSGSLISGSLRTWADATGLVPVTTPFGPSQVGAVLNALARRYGLSTLSVRSAWLSYVELACDLEMSRDVAEYVASFGDMDRTETHRHGTSTVRYETTKWDVVAYQKRPKVLRVELKCKAPASVFGRRLRAGQLSDPAFRRAAAETWLKRARRIPVRRVPRLDRGRLSAHERVRWYAVRSMEAAGGLDAALAEIDADCAAGLVKPTSAGSQRRHLRQLWGDPALTVPSGLEAEFVAAIDAVSTAYNIAY